MDAPVIGADSSPYPVKGTWDVFTSYRYQKSDRHFVGPDEQEHRTEEGSQVINWLHLLDLSVRYNVSDQSSLSLSIPYLIAERSSPIRDANRVVFDRSVTHSRGVGDVVFAYRRWILNTKTHKNANISLGAGLKIPTGAHTQHDTFKTFNNTTQTYEFTARPVDQSIQPGDGGLGFLLDAQAFLRFGAGNVGVFASGSYLFNPRNTDKQNRRNTPGSINEHLSVADQYIFRTGMSARIVKGLAVNGGVRLEGVPSQDAIGDSDGFRRPGYAWSFEPSLAWSHGRNSLSVGVPIAFYRNRTANSNDIENRDGQPGDAAFADWILMVGFSHHFD